MLDKASERKSHMLKTKIQQENKAIPTTTYLTPAKNKSI
jgi:hypothetical protein